MAEFLSDLCIGRVILQANINRMPEKPQFSPPFRWRSMARPLRVTGAKLKASDFLLRLSEARRRWVKESGVPVSASIDPLRKRHNQYSGF